MITPWGILEEAPAWMISVYFQLQEDDVKVYKKHEKSLLEILFPLHKFFRRDLYFMLTTCG